MVAKEELVARIAGLVESLAASWGLTGPRDFAMETDLTLPQIRILYMLASSPARITDIAQAHGMARANASSMVERLVRKGLVERVPCPNDRRVALACLTDKGRGSIEEVTRSEQSALEKVTAVLPDDELDVVAQALEILNRGAERMAADGDAAATRRAEN